MSAPATAPSRAIPTACPAKLSEVRSALRDYLAARFGLPGLSYAEPPTAYSEGWETYIFRFRLSHHKSLPRQFAVPLVLRIFADHHGIQRVRHEFAVQRSLRHLDYPVAEPLIREESCGYFGGPFLIREEIPGRTFLPPLISLISQVLS
jgi:hypothetical protein